MNPSSVIPRCGAATSRLAVAAVRATSRCHSQAQAQSSLLAPRNQTVRNVETMTRTTSATATRAAPRCVSSTARNFGSSSSGVARPTLKPMRSVLYTPGSSRHLYKIREIACDVSLIDLEVKLVVRCELSDVGQHPPSAANPSHPPTPLRITLAFTLISSVRCREIVSKISNLWGKSCHGLCLSRAIIGCPKFVRGAG